MTLLLQNRNILIQHNLVQDTSYKTSYYFKDPDIHL